MKKLFVCNLVLVISAIFTAFSSAQSGTDTNVRTLNSAFVDGAIGMDSRGIIRSMRDVNLPASTNPLFVVDSNGVPTQFDIFYFGFDAYRDLEVVANDRSILTGVIGLDKYAGVHSLQLGGLGKEVTGAGFSVTGPDFDYHSEISAYNAANPGSPIALPYFPFDVAIETPNDGVARDLEVAVDWRNTTNAFQGYYILDAYAGVHYINNSEVLDFLRSTPGAAGNDAFFNFFGFRPLYVNDYAGKTGEGVTQTRPAPYFLFTGSGGFPIAKDLEVSVRFDEMTTPVVASSQSRAAAAAAAGIVESSMFQPISISNERLNVSSTKYTSRVAVTNGYSILDGFGGVFTMVEDANGTPIPAPWENADTGNADPSVDAPYFANPPLDDGAEDYNIAIDIEIMPNGQGYCLLTRLGEVFVVNAVGKTLADNFVTPGIHSRLPVFGFDAARDLELVANSEGKIVGMYVVGSFGTIYRAGNVPSLPGNVLYFPSGFANDIELSPYQTDVVSPY